MASEDKFPTIRDFRDLLNDLVEKGYGSGPHHRRAPSRRRHEHRIELGRPDMHPDTRLDAAQGRMNEMVGLVEDEADALWRDAVTALRRRVEIEGMSWHDACDEVTTCYTLGLNQVAALYEQAEARYAKKEAAE